MKKKLMILGGSNVQLNCVRRAREMGLTAVVADYYSDPPAAREADLHLQISTFDVEACIRAAREYGIDGVISVGTDQPVLTAAKVSEACSLPSPITVPEALSVTDKQVMKGIFSARGIPTPEYIFLRSDGRFIGGDGAESEFSFAGPYVIKPVDSQGQRGIFKAESAEEVISYLPDTLSHSRRDLCLVEKYYESREVTVSAWLKDGTFYPLTATDRCLYPDPLHIGVCTGHRYPTVFAGEAKEILSLAADTARALGLRNGPFYLQLLRGDDGWKVNEAAARVGGAFEDMTIPALTGFDILGASIHTALGEDCEPPRPFDPAKLPFNIFVLLLFCRPGRVAKINGAEALRGLPFVRDLGFNYLAGDSIPAMTNATARFGHAVITGSRDEIEDNIRTFYDMLTVENEAGEDLLLKDVIDRDYLTFK